jgi:precorrin-2 methylase
MHLKENVYKVKFTCTHFEISTTVEFHNEWNDVAVIMKATEKLRSMYGLDVTKAKNILVEHMGTDAFGIWKLADEEQSDV